jgi:NAD(P)-dependent dehydrogenase (short-subunit alcohol dehydrogenase family)
MLAGRVQDKVAVVTGGGSGIGRATAFLLAEEGSTTVVADIDKTAAEAVVEEITSAGGKATGVEIDVSDETAWQEVIDELIGVYGRLDILVNNAGISISKPVAESSLDDWRKAMAVNLDGVFLGTKYAIEAMKNGGSIINVSSVSGITPSAGATAYCASKAAVRMFSKTVAIECADAETGIRVNVVTPGGVKTPMWEKEDFFKELMAEHGGTEEAFVAMTGDAPSHQFFTPEEVAKTILYLASDESSHLTGTEIVLDRGHTG